MNFRDFAREFQYKRELEKRFAALPASQQIIEVEAISLTPIAQSQMITTQPDPIPYIPMPPIQANHFSTYQDYCAFLAYVKIKPKSYQDWLDEKRY